MIQKSKSLEHKYKNKAGEELPILVNRPTAKQVNEGQKVYNGAFREALESGAILRKRVQHFMREQQLWDDEKQAEFEQLTKIINDGEKKLKRGKIKLSEARTIALGMADARALQTALNVEFVDLDSKTAEAQAEQARFNFYIASCTVYEHNGALVWRSVEDYLDNAGEPVAWEAASAMATLANNYDPDYEKKFPENSFLLEYKFIDSKLRLLDKQGRFIDRKGRSVDEQGRLIKYHADGTTYFVDGDGNPLDADGQYIVEDSGPFLPDDEEQPQTGAASEAQKND